MAIGYVRTGHLFMSFPMLSIRYQRIITVGAMGKPMENRHGTAIGSMLGSPFPGAGVNIVSQSEKCHEMLESIPLHSSGRFPALYL
ncbi:hypothetical protein NJLHNGOC_15355 [Novacetimonas cocois]|uniref:Uncharacterized protein n=1 Tax=Novacetimonas cocois TaxID=1747507 RepID=A0A365YPZ3_9PROT|nr:hypothetical protein NJLHNGOC_15355 [Novacetimonas cocois]